MFNSPWTVIFIMSFLFTLPERDVMVDPCYAATTWLVWFSVTFGQPSFSSSVSSISTIMGEAHHVRQTRNRQGWYSSSEHVYETAVHREERKFAPVERVEQPEVSKKEGRGGAPTSRDPGGGGWTDFRIDGFGLKKRTDCGFVLWIARICGFQLKTQWISCNFWRGMCLLNK